MGIIESLFGSPKKKYPCEERSSGSDYVSKCASGHCYHFDYSRTTTLGGYGDEPLRDQTTDYYKCCRCGATESR